MPDNAVSSGIIFSEIPPKGTRVPESDEVEDLVSTSDDDEATVIEDHMLPQTADFDTRWHGDDDGSNHSEGLL